MARLSRSTEIHAPPYRTSFSVARLNFDASGASRMRYIIVGVRTTCVTERRSMVRSTSIGSNSFCRMIVAPTWKKRSIRPTPPRYGSVAQERKTSFREKPSSIAE